MFEKFHGGSDPAEHGCGCGDQDEGLGDIDALLEVASKAAVLDEPGETTLDHPAARQWLEAR